MNLKPFDKKSLDISHLPDALRQIQVQSQVQNASQNIQRVEQVYYSQPVNTIPQQTIASTQQVFAPQQVFSVPSQVFRAGNSEAKGQAYGPPP